MHQLNDTQMWVTLPENVHLADAPRLLRGYARSGRVRGGSLLFPFPAPAISWLVEGQACALQVCL